MAEDMSHESYPFGLVLCLEQEELEKLEVDPTKHKVGDSVALDAIAKIIAIREWGMTLQITDLGLETDKDSDAKPVKTAGERLFGKEEK